MVIPIPMGQPQAPTGYMPHPAYQPRTQPSYDDRHRYQDPPSAAAVAPVAHQPVPVQGSGRGMFMLIGLGLFFGVLGFFMWRMFANR